MKNGIGFIAPLCIVGTLASPMANAVTGDAELGYSRTDGNTETTTTNAKIDMDHAMDKWRHNLFGDAYYSKNNGVKTAERFALAYKAKYFMSKQNYVFGLLRYDQDEFAFIDQRTTEVLGVGRQFINTPVHYLDAEVGVGARQTDYTVDPATATLDDSEDIVFLGGKYTGKISDNARFSQNLRVEIGGENTYTESITALGMSIAGNLSARVSYTVRHNSDVVGLLGDNTDTLTGLNLVYSY